MSDYMQDPLARRLETLTVPVPPSLVRETLARIARKPTAVHRPRRAMRAAATVAVVLLATTIGGSYFAPRFGETLADAPVLGGTMSRALRSVGLANVSGRVTSISDVANSSGYRVALVAGYADATRTVLLVKVTPASRSALLAGPQSVHLSDQFGRQYEMRGGFADAVTGDEALEFAPIGLPASSVGARLSLWLSNLRAVIGAKDALAGEWRLHATIALDESQSLPLPASGRLGSMTIAFTRMVSTPNVLQVTLNAQGASPNQLSRFIVDSAKGHPAFQLRLLDSAGQAIRPLSTQINGDAADVLWMRPSSGHYRLQVSYEDLGAFDREIRL